tara:strand:- start:5339 stop:6700 length:1362 start_codon:yes stop_codon:yes gene_type:complete
MILSKIKKNKESVDIREIAFKALNYFENNPQHTTDLFKKFCPHDLDNRDKTLLREIIYGVLRWRNRLDWTYEIFLNKPIDRLSHQIKQALRIGVYQLIFLDRIPNYSAINTSVDLLKNTKDIWAKGLVNAVLRKISNSKPFPSEEIIKDLSIWESHPKWLTRKWTKELGPELAKNRCQSNNQIPNVVLRVNLKWGSVEDLSDRLVSMGYNLTPGLFDPDCLHLATSPNVRNNSLTDNDLFREGAFWILDEASSLVTRYANPKSGNLIWDSCAAPGGKTVGLYLSLGENGNVLASDFSVSRIDRLKINCFRMNAKVNILIADVLDEIFNDVFDLVLLDAPCSSLGVLRRHPDARWRLERNKLKDFSKRQKHLLDAVSKSVRPGGVLVYSVCSNEPEETDLVTSAFTSKEFFVNVDKSNFPDSAMQFIQTDGSLQIKPEDGNIDGFYAMRWKRRK